jgi:aminocarboxymuconate-semialdehyde decarboxylase
VAEAINQHRPGEDGAQQAGRNPLWPLIERKGADGAAVLVGGKVFRVIDSRSWDAKRRIDDMSADDVDVQVISPMPELLSHWFPAADADTLCRYINEGIAELCQSRKIHGISMAPMQMHDLSPSSGSTRSNHCGLRGTLAAPYRRYSARRYQAAISFAARQTTMVMVHPLHRSVSTGWAAGRNWRRWPFCSGPRLLRCR